MRKQEQLQLAEASFRDHWVVVCSGRLAGNFRGFSVEVGSDERLRRM